jgi:fermentation-respiration switch protein FrsA (DUF1100 family)
MLFRWFEHGRVYHPTRILVAQGGDLGRPFESVFFKTSDDVELNGWFFPGDPDSPRLGKVVLFCHGNGGNISHRLEVYRTLLERGVNVLSFDYRGYGQSRGRPGEEETYLDAQAAHAWLRRHGFAAKNIIAYGESLGGAIASELCLRNETGGLVLQATFTSIPDVGADIYPWLPVRRFSRIKYDTLNKLPRLKIPVLVMHSRNDRLVDYRHAQRNFSGANEPKVFCDLGGGHNDPTADRRAFVEGMEKFLQLLERLQA